MELYFEGEGILGMMWGRMKGCAAKCVSKWGWRRVGRRARWGFGQNNEMAVGEEKES